MSQRWLGATYHWSHPDERAKLEVQRGLWAFGPLELGSFWELLGAEYIFGVIFLAAIWSLWT